MGPANGDKVDYYSKLGRSSSSSGAWRDAGATGARRFGIWTTGSGSEAADDGPPDMGAWVVVSDPPGNRKTRPGNDKT